MPEILKSTMLNFEKSFFYINFEQSSSDGTFITVEQTMANNYSKQKIKIDLGALKQIISTLQLYEHELNDPNSDICKNYLLKDKQQLVIQRHLKGISVPDLALQFDCTSQTIEAILSTHKIEFENEKNVRKQRMIGRSKRKY
jgi:hypothetical protein